MYLTLARYVLRTWMRGPRLQRFASASEAAAGDAEDRRETPARLRLLKVRPFEMREGEPSIGVSFTPRLFELLSDVQVLVEHRGLSFAVLQSLRDADEGGRNRSTACRNSSRIASFNEKNFMLF